MHQTLRQMVVALIAFAVVAMPSLASNRLPGEPQVRAFSMAEYGSNEQNWSVSMGPDGLVYVGGGMGLLAYNGVAWTLYDTPNHSRVRQLLVDNQGRFWIGSSDQFGYFQREANGAMRYHSLSDSLPEDQRGFGDIRDLVELNGSLYFLALRSVFRYDGKTLDRLDSWDGVFRLLLKHKDQALVAVGRHLFDITDFANPRPEPLAGWQWPQGARLTFLEPWPDGRILAGTYDDGMYWLSDDSPERFKVDFDLTKAWPFIVKRREDGSLLIGTRHAGLLHIAADGRLLEHVSLQNGLPKNMITGMGEDGQGGIWLAQDGYISRVALDAPLRSWGKSSGLSGTRGMTRHNGHTVLAVGGGLVQLVAEGSDSAHQVSLDSPLIEAWDVHADKGQLLAAGSEGVHRLDYDFSNGELRSHQRLLSDHYAYRLTPSRYHPVIYAEMETGLSLLRRVDGQWTDGGRVNAVEERPHHVAEDRDGNVWVGTVKGRFYQLAWREDGRNLDLLTILDSDDGVPAGYAWPFAVSDRLVLGTSEGGFRPVRDGNGKVIAVEPDPVFNNDQLGESRGIFKLASPDGRRVIGGIGSGGALRFGWMTASGEINWQTHPVPGIEIGQNNFLLAEDDAVWIGRAPGLVRLEWPSPDRSHTPAALYVVRAGYPEADDWLLHGPNATSPQPSKPLSSTPLSFQNTPLRFEYALAEFVYPETHRYRVWLEGLDDDWSQWSDETRRDYTHLPGGHYRFHVEARDGRNLISSTPPLAFTVTPPWYLGKPMQAAYLLMAVLLL